MDNRKTVLLADANEEFRRLLQKAIENTGEFTVVGSVGDGMEALRLIEEQEPELVLQLVQVLQLVLVQELELVLPLEQVLQLELVQELVLVLPLEQVPLLVLVQVLH